MINGIFSIIRFIVRIVWMAFIMSVTFLLQAFIFLITWC